MGFLVGFCVGLGAHHVLGVGGFDFFDGLGVGERVGWTDGRFVGFRVGQYVGFGVGASVGQLVGAGVGHPVGIVVGAPVGGSQILGNKQGMMLFVNSVTDTPSLLLFPLHTLCASSSARQRRYESPSAFSITFCALDAVMRLTMYESIDLAASLGAVSSQIDWIRLSKHELTTIILSIRSSFTLKASAASSSAANRGERRKKI